ncbi:MAG: tetratricopeptide repeat protein [Clostridiaceae bacterium]
MKIVVDWFIPMLQNPVIQGILATAIYEGGKFIFKKTLGAKKKTAGWQLTDSMERAFFQTESDLGWTHDTEAIRNTFFTSLFPFSKSFSKTTMEQAFTKALGRPVTETELDTWIANVLDQISLPEHETLFRFLQLNHIFIPEPTHETPKYPPILTPGASVWDDQNILARDEFIDSLCIDFSQHPRRIQLVGMGGIGKTEILNKLYAKLATKPDECGFDFVGLVHFSGVIESDIAQQIEYPAQYHGLQGEKAALNYLHDLCMEHRVLLLIDDIRAQQPLPKAKDNPLQYLTTLGASVLLASRVPFPQFKRRYVDVLPIEECIEIFEKQYGRAVTDEEERKLLTKIIEEKAGQNTLIVNRLGGMAKDPGWSIKELFNHLEAQQFSIPKGVADDETLQFEINKLYTLDKDFTSAEISILEAFSIFPAIPLALDLCKEWLSSDAGVEPDDCTRILARLAQKTWLIRHEGEEGSSAAMYSMHQVVREAAKEQLEIEGSTHIEMINACTEALKQSTNNYMLAIAAQIIPFAITIFEAIHEENAPITFLSDAIGNYYLQTAAYSLALKWRQKAATLAEKVFGVKHENTAAAYNNIAYICDSQGNYPKALEWYFKSLRIKEKILGIEHPSTATTYNNIAVVYKSQGDYPKALEWFFKGLEISEKVLGKNHPSTATTYNNIAGVYKNLGDYPKALEWYFKALDIREKVLGKEHPDTATTYNNIAVVYKNQGDYPKALEWYFKALDIREKVLGKEHPDTATTYNNIAGVYNSQGDYVRALEWFFKALYVKEKVLGKEHPSTATTYNNIANVYYYQGDYQAALECLHKALTVFEVKLGREHPNTKIVQSGIEIVTAKLSSTDPVK